MQSYYACTGAGDCKLNLKHCFSRSLKHKFIQNLICYNNRKIKLVTYNTLFHFHNFLDQPRPQKFYMEIKCTSHTIWVASISSNKFAICFVFMVKIINMESSNML